MPVKTLVLVRHAHREVLLNRSLDQGLSLKGIRQAKRILKRFKSKIKKENAETWLVVSSPKLRCQQTVEGLGKLKNCQFEIREDLNEGHSERDVSLFLNWFRHVAPSQVVACSHGDWIPEFCRQALGIHVDLSKGGWMELEYSSLTGQFELLWLLQSLKS